MTYNILCTNTNLTSIANMIRQHLPDLIAFQEMTVSQSARLSEVLEKEYPYRKTSYQVPCGSTAVFSRLPIVHHRIVDLMSDRPVMLATVVKDNMPVVFVSAHLLPMYRARIQSIHNRPAAINDFIADKARQVEILIETLLEFDSKPIIIGCDCNTVLTHSTYKTLRQSFVDSAIVTGNPDSIVGTKKNNNPYQLDYIFFRGALKPVANYRLAENAGSDHRPVITTFVLEQ